MCWLQWSGVFVFPSSGGGGFGAGEGCWGGGVRAGRGAGASYHQKRFVADLVCVCVCVCVCAASFWILHAWIPLLLLPSIHFMMGVLSSSRLSLMSVHSTSSTSMSISLDITPLDSPVVLTILLDDVSRSSLDLFLIFSAPVSIACGFLPDFSLLPSQVQLGQNLYCIGFRAPHF